LDPGLGSATSSASHRPLRAASSSSSGLGRDPDANSSLRPPVSMASWCPVSGRRFPPVASTTSATAAAASSAASPRGSWWLSRPVSSRPDRRKHYARSSKSSWILCESLYLLDGSDFVYTDYPLQVSLNVTADRFLPRDA